MIRKLTIDNFKCFEHLDIELSNLNVLAGVNSMGKSSVIQAILLLRQAYDMDSIDKGLHLNGEITKVGTGHDLLYRDSENEIISIGVKSSDNVEYKWNYIYEKDSDYLKISSTTVTGKDIDNINIFRPTFSYISAERIGPKSFYEKSYHKVFEKNQVGYRGELFADYLAERGQIDKVENEYALHKDVESPLLMYQVEAWLSEISPSIHISSKKYNEAGIVGIGYKTYDNEYTPINVGFGLSYVIPIIVALLKAKSGDLVILENPEAHLHPRGQRKIGELISKVSAGGVQIILETHSDHILNGIRLSVKNKVIDRNLVHLNYFFVDDENSPKRHQNTSIAILENGNLSAWPKGFFDEWDKAIDELF